MRTNTPAPLKLFWKCVALRTSLFSASPIMALDLVGNQRLATAWVFTSCNTGPNQLARVWNSSLPGKADPASRVICHCDDQVKSATALLLSSRAERGISQSERGAHKLIS